MNKIGRFLVLFSFLVLGLISCEKEALDGEITIRFALGDGAYGTDETRGTGLGERDLEAETIVVPVEGVLHMYATLEEEPTLRAAGDETMETGTIIVIAAYDENGDYVDKAEYEVTDGNGGIKPTAADGIGLTITTAGDYTFVAYSLNTTSSFTYSNNMGPYSANSSGDDPLWGSTKVPVSAGMNRVDIKMRHVFSKVKIRALSTELSGTPAISNVSATLVGYKAVIQDGAIGKGDAEEQAFEAFPASPTTDALSAPRVVYAGGEDITTIKINSATIGTATHTGSVARFNKKLLPGHSYTLTVKFDELVWAGSNVYWVITSGNNGYLTFDATDKGNQGYQGVFFKWGSLVGISPTQTSGSNNFTNTTPVYMPTYNVGTPTSSTWVRSTGYDPAKWVSTVSGAAENGADAIPYLDGRSDFNASDNTRNNTFVIDAERNKDAMYLGKRGDICQYIGKTQVALKGFRLPTSSEFGTVIEDWNGTTAKGGGWQPLGDWTWNNAAGNPEGSSNLRVAAKNNANTVFSAIQNNGMGGVVLPASGYRGEGTMATVGSVGNYWSGSSYSETHGWRIDFHATSVRPNIAAYRSDGFAVRCVKN
jgi:uncharacterized protein (TIGR02145 family)